MIRRRSMFGASGVPAYHQRMNSSNMTSCSLQRRLGFTAIQTDHCITCILIEPTTMRNEKRNVRGWGSWHAISVSALVRHGAEPEHMREQTCVEMLKENSHGVVELRLAGHPVRHVLIFRSFCLPLSLDIGSSLKLVLLTWTALL